MVRWWQPPYRPAVRWGVALVLVLAAGAAAAPFLRPDVDDTVTADHIPPPRSARRPAEAARLADRVDLPAIALADRVVVSRSRQNRPAPQTVGQPITVGNPQLLDSIRSKLVPGQPYYGYQPTAIDLAFYRGGRFVRQVFVDPSGAWGVVRPGTPYTLGSSPALYKMLDDILAVQEKAGRMGRPGAGK